MNLEQDELHYDGEENEIGFGPYVTLVQTVKDGDFGKRIVRRRMPAYFAIVELNSDANGVSVMSAHIEWGGHSDIWSQSL